MKNKKLRSPIKWFGGKSMMASKLLPLIPPHHTYVEVFGGGASLLFAKEPSPVEVYNDIDEGLVNFFRVLRDPAKFHYLFAKCALTPYSRAEHVRCLKTWEENEDDIEKAYRWFVAARMSFGGMFGTSWGFVRKTSTNNMAQCCSSWLGILRNFGDIHIRVMRVQIDCLDWRKVLDNYDDEDTFFYLDPPYLQATRRSGEYKHELTETDHHELVERLLVLKGKAMLSGYPNEVYKPLEDAGWERIEFDTVCSAVGRTRFTGILGKGSAKEKQPRTECVWLSYKDRIKSGTLF